MPTHSRRRCTSRSRNSIYFLADNYLRFWYRYIDPARGILARGLGDRIRETSIVPTLNEFISKPAFERVYRQYLWQAMAREALPAGLSFSDMGRWWGASDVEIDVVVVNEGGDVLYIALISRSGFSQRLKELSAAQDPARLLLVAVEDLIRL